MSAAARQTATGAAGILVALAVWQWLATAGPLAGGTLPSAVQTFVEAGRLVTTGDFWAAVGETLAIALGGLAIATAAGVLVGMLIGVSPLAMFATRVPLEFLKPIPPIVILPILVLVLGPTLGMAVTLVAFGCVLGIVMQTEAGVADTDQVLLATARSYGLRRAEILGRVTLPSAMPYIGTSVRIAAPTALIVAVVAGLLGGGPGLGQSLLLAQIGGNRPGVFATVLLLGVLGLLVQAASNAAERRLLHWHPQHRKALA